jgi:DNA polymerase (family 10)
MDKKRIVETLDEIGTLLELTGENPFRSRAYHNGAQVVGGLIEDLDELIKVMELLHLSKVLVKDLQTQLQN